MKMRSQQRAIEKIYKRRDRYEIPEWPRQEVWSRSKIQNLIDSILRGWKLPKFCFLKLSDQPEEYEVVDGQQRLAAIFEFFDNDLPLPEDAAKEFEAAYCRDLSDEVPSGLRSHPNRPLRKTVRMERAREPCRSRPPGRVEDAVSSPGRTPGLRDGAAERA